ncbi:hypothetical protein K505DRAFT_399483 [Melanomma pulvis-pyrius CBS 109.77]|uniref:Uncharacterized protein n=1 Tax=Melanomma pulvis-pyrius CBS 109.77 TaxID=1314802 RepID=A0A6A6WQV5_9PLEO|nr:hypothetical protein K505DRAFT_399483 [Melanomma pulvis-pyrius CBS 109.77]
MKIGLPVRSALHKHDTGGLVVKWVTIGESLLLYVFANFAKHFVSVPWIHETNLFSIWQQACWKMCLCSYS